jgi:large subunit ribosomal protein L6
MSLCKSQLTFTKTTLIKKQYLCSNTWIIWIFGPLGLIQLKLKLLYIQILPRNLIFIQKKKIKLWLSKVNVELVQVKNILLGLHKGYFLKLKIVGVGYKVFKSSTKLNCINIHLGYSHPIIFNYPPQMKFYLFKRSLKIWSCNKQQLYQVAFFLYSLKKPDLYKGKGLIPKNISTKLKPGKKSKT